MKKVTQDCLTGYPLDPQDVKHPTEYDIHEYFHRSVGNVRVSGTAYISILGTSDQDRRNILAGICRNLNPSDALPIVLLNKHLSVSLEELEKDFDLKIPRTFEEKWRYILEYLDRNGGREFKKFHFESYFDFPLTYGDSDEFTRVLEYLLDRKFIGGERKSSKDGPWFSKVTLTEKGIAILESVDSALQQITIDDQLKSILHGHFKELIGKDIAAVLDKFEEVFEKAEIKAGVKFIMIKRTELADLRNREIKNTITSEEASVRMQRLSESVLNVIL